MVRGVPAVDALAAPFAARNHAVEFAQLPDDSRRRPLLRDDGFGPVAEVVGETLGRDRVGDAVSASWRLQRLRGD